MLYTLVDRVCAELDAVPIGIDPELAEEIRAAAPEAVAKTREWNRQQGRKMTEVEAARPLALVAQTYIKGVPSIARAMVEKAKDRRAHAARRCAVASVLAYLVQPHDIIPDNAPGCYGYLDDAILLHAGVAEYLDTLPTPTMDADAHARVAQVLIGLAPAAARPALQQGVSSMSQVVQLLSMMDSDIAEGTLAMIVANPLQASSNVAAPPRGFSPRSGRDYSKGHWSGGAYFEGNNVVMSGGPSLIDGQLFIPG
jgi:uncharacterized membrane protein YkvA (DUF1232 family)